MQKLLIPTSLTPFVQEIMLLERKEEQEHHFPFYADGFAGIAYSRSVQPFFQRPLDKQLSPFYLFGQTITPITIEVMGSFKLLVIRLFPFAIRMLLGIDTRSLNDDCYDLRKLNQIDTQQTLQLLDGAASDTEIVEIIGEYMEELIRVAASNPDYRIKMAINLILEARGVISVQAIRERLYVGERTLERQFQKEVGVSPKQFAKIIQFSASMQQLNEADYVQLTDIGFDNGFADQSHFIRAFKRYTGKTPKEIQKQISA